MKTEKPPSSGPKFEAMMVAIDSKLAADGVNIPARLLVAVNEVSLKHGLSLPLADADWMPSELRQNVAISQAVNGWYSKNYGDRLKHNPCPGEAVLLLDGDLYVLRVPRIYGRVKFVLLREWQPDPKNSRGPTIANIVQLVSEMTPAKAKRLSDASLKALGTLFEITLPAFHTLESTQHPLIQIARGDVETAVTCLMADRGRFGESKWASLQAAEKVLKAAIDLAGLQYPVTHDLTKLCAIFESAGPSFDLTGQIAAIQCRPDIRYGAESCSREQAVAAHHASLELINVLRHGGAKFELGMGGFEAS